MLLVESNFIDGMVGNPDCIYTAFPGLQNMIPSPGTVYVLYDPLVAATALTIAPDVLYAPTCVLAVPLARTFPTALIVLQAIVPVVMELVPFVNAPEEVTVPHVNAPVVMELVPLEKFPDDVTAPHVNVPVVMAFVPLEKVPDEVMAPELNAPVVMALAPLEKVPEEVMAPHEMAPSVDELVHDNALLIVTLFDVSILMAGFVAVALDAKYKEWSLSSFASPVPANCNDAIPVPLVNVLNIPPDATDAVICPHDTSPVVICVDVNAPVVMAFEPLEKAPEEVMAPDVIGLVPALIALVVNAPLIVVLLDVSILMAGVVVPPLAKNKFVDPVVIASASPFVVPNA